MRLSVGKTREPGQRQSAGTVRESNEAALAGGVEVEKAAASRRTPKEAWASMANLGEMGD
jgi:hypothetical protein